MEEKKEATILDLEDIITRMAGAVAIVNTIWVAMEKGASSAESHVNALFGASNYLHEVCDDLQECFSAIHAADRNRKASGSSERKAPA